MTIRLRRAASVLISSLQGASAAAPVSYKQDAARAATVLAAQIVLRTSPCGPWYFGAVDSDARHEATRCSAIGRPTIGRECRARMAGN
jgi:hypothetical protein